MMILEASNDSYGDFSMDEDESLVVYDETKLAAGATAPSESDLQDSDRSDQPSTDQPSDLSFEPHTQQPCDKARSLVGDIPRLLPEAQQNAIDFVLEYGTNLQRERLLYHFPSHHLTAEHKAESNLNVLAALSHYQNEDGGFGHGLEADLRTKQSTVIATTIGLQILEGVNALDSELAKRAEQYLITNFTQAGWHAIHSQANDAPHAPWWKFEQFESDQTRENTFLANPTAEVLKYLLDSGAMASEATQLLTTAIEYLTQTPLEMHELLCYTRLYESKALIKEQRLAMLPHLLSNGFRLVNTQTSNWEEYCLTPLSVVTHPGSIFAEFFADTIADNFNFLIESQNDDGSWSPNWSWAGEFPATWKTVQTEIKAELTLKNLLQFSAFKGLSGQSA